MLGTGRLRQRLKRLERQAPVVLFGGCQQCRNWPEVQVDNAPLFEGQAPDFSCLRCGRFPRLLIVLEPTR
jgi:hypothetical protein